MSCLGQAGNVVTGNEIHPDAGIGWGEFIVYGVGFGDRLTSRDGRPLNGDARCRKRLHRCGHPGRVARKSGAPINPQTTPPCQKPNLKLRDRPATTPL